METPPAKTHAAPSLRQALLDETTAMLEAVLERGKEVPPDAVTTLEAFAVAAVAAEPIPDDRSKAMLTLHTTLARTLAPATPRTIALLRRERHREDWRRWLGPIDLIRHLMIAALISLVAFVGFCASDATDVLPKARRAAAERAATTTLAGTATGTAERPTAGSGTSIAAQGGAAPTAQAPAPRAAAGTPGATDGSQEQRCNIMTMQPFHVVMNVGMWLAAAGLGASFVCLYKANRYVTEGTFDPMYVGSYWIRFFLGLIAGLMLAVVVNEDLFNNLTLLEPDLVKVPMAMLGGFSAELFYTFLARLVETCKSLFQGSTESLVQTEVERERAAAAGRQVQHRVQLATQVIALQRAIGATPNPEEIRRQLDDLLRQVLPPAAADPAGGARGGGAATGS